MPLTVDQIYDEAILLPNEAKALLAEKLVENLETHVDSAIEKSHLVEVKRRRDEIRSGKVQSIPGEEALAQARHLVAR
ncbi:MAG: addiction module protein [bacterium]|nr:addiction module protein [bacterium]